MKIEIDGVDVPYQLDGEKVLGDLIPTLRLYLFNQGRMIEQLLVDGAGRGIDAQLPITQIGLLSLTTAVILDLDEVSKRANTLLKHIETGKGCQLDKCAHNITQWAKSVEFWLQDFSLSPDFFQLLARLPQYDGKAEETSLYQKALTVVVRCLAERNAELEDPITVTLHGMQALLEKEQAMLDMGITLQSNQDATSAYEILLFTEALQKLKRVSRLLPESHDALYDRLDAWLEESLGIMTQMVEAFDTKDFILTADLAEYELVERLQSLKTLEEEFRVLSLGQS
ncbi:hypothetical protein [Entomospira culicis]|uniref:Uncharacterized protein n=1 Tax=Entomospira culicis TaxID=2719989 RepID=A0A968KYU5_9SPIO|nr:hypothetical protein [Entomospira culicis]NIZ18445.1 hypothetical protein [Entomospira culicis]NIZ68661.1 hypothetical protein [Entomospira culicis]WDI37260.1 hypothetical protein PVA46_00275 [Entomospira culicis]WDI38889.1 hypothetical protein PVA47_00285 [Entomospira culicis]